MNDMTNDARTERERKRLARSVIRHLKRIAPEVNIIFDGDIIVIKNLQIGEMWTAHWMHAIRIDDVPAFAAHCEALRVKQSGRTC